MDGTYAFVYSGLFGVGVGVLEVTDSHVVGVDCGGGRYRGEVAVDDTTGEITLSFDLFEPRGVVLTAAAPSPTKPPRQMAITLPPAFGGGQPVSLRMPHDVVTLMIRPVAAGSMRDLALFSASNVGRSGTLLH